MWREETLNQALTVSPVTFEEFKDLVEALGPFEPYPRIAVAVSGGKDSLALTLLLKQWIDQIQGHLIALTVDHQLRPESKDEALQLHAWLSDQKIEHHILTWEGAKPLSHLQEEARNARYTLLEAWCRSQGILHLFLAHHADDQKETFIMRLERGSGLDGLCGMAPIVETPYIRILRPLLTISSKRLQAYLQQLNQPWIEDPSNVKDCYRRNQIRRNLAFHLNESAEDSILKTVETMTADRIALEAETMKSLAQCCQISQFGYAVVFLDTFKNEPKHLQIRLLSLLLMLISGAGYPPRTLYLERLYETLNNPSSLRTRTCWGCVLRPYKGHLMIIREDAAIQDQLPVIEGQYLRWDQRFWISYNTKKMRDRITGQPTLAKLGRKGWKQIAKFVATTYDSKVISHVFPTLPALWLDAAVVAVPHLRFYAKHDGWSDDTVEITFLPKKMSYKPLFTIH